MCILSMSRWIYTTCYQQTYSSTTQAIKSYFEFIKSRAMLLVTVHGVRVRVGVGNQVSDYLVTLGGCVVTLSLEGEKVPEVLSI